jgi:hypothetical protein
VLHPETDGNVFSELGRKSRSVEKPEERPADMKEIITVQVWEFVATYIAWNDS